jgi:hypothetical protein
MFALIIKGNGYRALGWDVSRMHQCNGSRKKKSALETVRMTDANKISEAVHQKNYYSLRSKL